MSGSTHSGARIDGNDRFSTCGLVWWSGPDDERRDDINPSCLLCRRVVPKTRRGSKIDAAATREGAAKLKAENALLRGELAKAGVCLCESEIDDPGPHTPSCPWSDPEYDGDGSSEEARPE